MVVSCTYIAHMQAHPSIVSSLMCTHAGETYMFTREVSIGVVVTFLLTVLLNNTILFAVFYSCKRSK